MWRCLRVLDKAVVGIWYLVLGFEFNAGFSLLCVLPRESAPNFFQQPPTLEEGSRLSCKLFSERKRRGSGDPSGLQNRRELASLALVSSTLTRFRQFCFQVVRGVFGRKLPISALTSGGHSHVHK